MLIVGLGVGLVIGIVVGIVIGRESQKKASNHDSKNRFDIKKEKLELLRVFIADKKEITNKEVEDFLEMSDATVTRYLDELEKEGLVKQIGKVGANVKYEVK